MGASDNSSDNSSGSTGRASNSLIGTKNESAQIAALRLQLCRFPKDGRSCPNRNPMAAIEQIAMQRGGLRRSHETACSCSSCNTMVATASELRRHGVTGLDADAGTLQDGWDTAEGSSHCRSS